MRRRAAPIGWPRYDPRLHRFAIPNAVWEHEMKPAEFAALAAVYANNSSIMDGAEAKYLSALRDNGLLDDELLPTLKCCSSDFIPRCGA